MDYNTILTTLSDLATKERDVIDIDLGDIPLTEEIFDALSLLRVSEGLYVYHRHKLIISYEQTVEYQSYADFLATGDNDDPWWLYIQQDIWQISSVTKLIGAFGENLDVSEYNPTEEIREALFTMKIRCVAVSQFTPEVILLVSLNNGIIHVYANTNLGGKLIDGSPLVHGIGERPIRRLLTLQMYYNEEDEDVVIYLFPGINFKQNVIV